MTSIVSVICASHSPYLFQSPEQWTQAQQTRAAAGNFREPFAIDTLEQNVEKHGRCMRAFEVLRRRLEADAPDFLVIFGDDQNEQFQFSNFPAFAIFTGDTFGGYKISRYQGIPLPGGKRPERPKTPEHWATVSNRTDVAKYLLTSLVRSGFDIAFCTGLADPDEGMGHAFTRPSYYLDPDYSKPVVPILINCFYGPQPTGRRCCKLGLAVRELVEALPGNARVTILGSGGLWHTPMMPRSYLNEEFDRGILSRAAKGDAAGMAEFFDAYEQPFDLTTEEGLKMASGGTGVVLGLGSGIGETRTWIAAVAAAGGQPGEIVDYVQIGASPVGVAFAHFKLS